MWRKWIKMIQANTTKGGRKRKIGDLLKIYVAF